MTKKERLERLIVEGQKVRALLKRIDGLSGDINYPGNLEEIEEIMDSLLK